jgi:hypothetical protein
VSSLNASVRADAPLLPVPTDVCTDVGSLLLSLTSSPERRIDILIGPSDSGKSAILRELVAAYRREGRTIRFVDLSLAEWRTTLSPDDSVDVMIIDHIDRIASSENLEAAFAMLDRGIANLVSLGLLRVLISFSSDWTVTFRHAYKLSPEVVLQRSIPTVRVETHTIRPYHYTELANLCTALGLDETDFSDQSLRRAGVLAMASSISTSNPDMTGARLREVLLARWLQAGNDQTARRARQMIWNLMAKWILRGDRFLLFLSGLYAESEGQFTTDTLRAQTGGPVRWENNQVQPESPAWGDLAAAKALEGVINGHDSPPIRSPVRTTVLDALIDISDPRELAQQVERKLSLLQGHQFEAIGYLGPVLGTLLARVQPHRELRFAHLSLQGPNHTDLPAVEQHVAQAVEEVLLAAMAQSLADLIASLSTVVRASLSGYRGGYRCWAYTREWAARLPLRAEAEDAVIRLLPQDGSWHYEDILDVAVTGATTRLMSEHSSSFESVLDRGAAPSAEYLADIWDGINDGVWDQIDANSKDFVSSLRIPTDTEQALTAVGCSMQRARVGNQDAAGWRLIDCDLLLADFRSCRNLEIADFSGSNWWAAILPPPARYHLSRSCSDSTFVEWCDAPPWRNPFFTGPWPRPFG